MNFTLFYVRLSHLIIIVIIITWFKRYVIHSKWRIASVEESRVTEGRHNYINRAHLSLFLNVLAVTVKSEMTDWGRLFQTKGDEWQKARLQYNIRLLHRSQTATTSNMKQMNTKYNYLIVETKESGKVNNCWTYL